MIDTIDSIVQEELQRIAPEIEVENVNQQGDLREEFDIDSIDFLTLVTALSKRFDVAMPESDYPRMMSVSALVGYLKKMTAKSP